jgi:hypothetical protein
MEATKKSGVTLLTEAVNKIINELDQATGYKAALYVIHRMINREGAYYTARDLGVLQDNSAEDFMIEFMSQFNEEYPGTY